MCNSVARVLRGGMSNRDTSVSSKAFHIKAKKDVFVLPVKIGDEFLIYSR